MVQKLDGHIDAIPQNCVKPDQCVKHCCFGCVSGGKRDTASAFVAPAVATGASQWKDALVHRSSYAAHYTPLSLMPCGMRHSGTYVCLHRSGIAHATRESKCCLWCFGC